MSEYNVIMSTEESTVVSEYIPQFNRSSSYQSEASLEKAFIDMLEDQGYEYLNITSSEQMIENLRFQLEKLNDIKFSDNEWTSFYENNIANKNEGIVQKTRKIQEDYIQILKRDDGSTKNIRLIDKKNIQKNYLQVINQYEENKGNYENRYDVTVLVNGLPLVHIELKRRGVALKEAFNQIERYQRESFWAGNGLYEYVQIFVISNGTNTKYYSNTTRFSAIDEKKKKGTKKTSNSFEFTCFWSDANNNKITDLVDFTKTFFSKHTILNILIKYTVFTSENLLLVMRPYQIVAAERIINRILVSYNYKKQGSIEAGGYIWHTTGSGKTLTSFKTAQLASKMEEVDKVLFVVDRKDLDYQTIKEYDRFEKGSANGNRNTKVLERQLSNINEKGSFHDYKIIVTTIQKLDKFIKSNQKHDIYNKNVVMIFDECHRSQFGQMHKNIVAKFKKYYIFGFTGTPIFKENSSLKLGEVLTTPQVFGDKLHTYTIVDAINDGNVLPFRIDYINTMKAKDDLQDAKIEAINQETALLSNERISEITKYILEHFDMKTKRNSATYKFNKLVNIEQVAKSKEIEKKEASNINGFNSIFAVSSIEAAKKYYLEFKKQMQQENSKKLKIAVIYSYGANEAESDFVEDENSDDTEGLDLSSREFLESSIKDYNEMFGTSYDTSSEKFPNYYKDVSLRMKNREIDMLIVVNMFLTGFDATTLNTLWVDKNLQMHGLIQAFSRTNRILNAVKTYGNIVCFRDLQKETNDAIGLFGDKNACGIVLLKTFDDYYYGYEQNGKTYKGYKQILEELLEKFPLSQEIIGEKHQKEFLMLFGSFLRVRNILSCFDDFEDKKELADIDFQDYTGRYNDLYRPKDPRQKENIFEDIVFELELVKQVEVNIDYVLNLIEKYKDSNRKDKQLLLSVEKAISSSFELRSKKELINQFINKINLNENNESFTKFVTEEFKNEIEVNIQEKKLKRKEFLKYMSNCFKDSEVKTTGTSIDGFMQPFSMFDKNRKRKKEDLIEDIKEIYNKYNGVLELESIKEYFNQ